MEKRNMECFPLSFLHIWKEGSRRSIEEADLFLTIRLLVMANRLYTSELIITIDQVYSSSVRETNRSGW